MIGGFSAYSKVTYECCTRLAQMGHNVAHVPMGKANKMGKQSYKDVLIYPSGNHAFAEDVAIPHYLDWRADMLIAFKETWCFNDIFKYAINFVPYVPIDHSPVSPALTARLRTAFRVITPSRHGKRELEYAGIPDVHYIPHGISTDVYKPLENKAECRKSFFLDPDEFVVLYVGWNRVRKMIPRMLRGFKRFQELNPDVRSRFMLWTPVQPPRRPGESTIGVADVGVNLLPEMVELDLTDACRWPSWNEVEKIGGLPEWDPTGGWDMVKLYNAADVLLSCTGGEGFGMTLVEAQACGVPVITTAYAAGPEQVGAGLTVKASDYNLLNTPGTRIALADIDQIAEALTNIMNSDKEKLAEKARDFVMCYDWPVVMDKYWKPFLEEAETELHARITKKGVDTWERRQITV